jgi:hypothetical protein
MNRRVVKCSGRWKKKFNQEEKITNESNNKKKSNYIYEREQHKMIKSMQDWLIRTVWATAWNPKRTSSLSRHDDNDYDDENTIPYVRSEVLTAASMKIGFEVLTAVSTNMAVLRVIAPCSLIEVYRRCRDVCCLHHQGDDDSTRLVSCSHFILPLKVVKRLKKQKIFVFSSDAVRSANKVKYCKRLVFKVFTNTLWI